MKVNLTRHSKNSHSVLSVNGMHTGSVMKEGKCFCLFFKVSKNVSNRIAERGIISVILKDDKFNTYF